MIAGARFEPATFGFMRHDKWRRAAKQTRCTVRENGLTAWRLIEPGGEFSRCSRYVFVWESRPAPRWLEFDLSIGLMPDSH
jgi:hypothetical protein